MKFFGNSRGFRTLTDSVWAELAIEGESAELEISLIRRNLQREHLKKLSKIVISQRRNSLYDLYSFIMFYGNRHSYPADAKSLSRLHLRELGEQVEGVLKVQGDQIDDITKAYLEEVQTQITLVLEAKLEANGP